MENNIITDSIKYIGANDKTIDLFENQYIVPNGMAYNSYIIMDDKIAIMDTIDKSKKDEWLDNLKRELKDKKPDYLIVSHMEPDHSACIKVLVDMYPDMKIVGNIKTFEFLKQFLQIDDLDTKKLVVKENDELNLGRHKLKFIMAPMIHWPEVMMTYEAEEQVLFTADAFGKFGALDADEDWTCEARRYYFCIVGKYGMQVQMLLQKIKKLNVKMICPLHGPILKENISKYVEKYDIWSKYESETKGIFIACASIHGNTYNAVKELEKLFRELGEENIIISDLCREDWAECVENAFRYDRIILAASSYNMGVFTPMHNFLESLLERNYQNKKIGLIENGTWAPSANKAMQGILEKMKNIEICENKVTIKSTLDDSSRKALSILAKEITNLKKI